MTDRPRFVYLLHVAQRRVGAAIASTRAGSSAARAGLVMALAPERGARPSELARALDLGAPALSALLDRMLRAKLIKRTADPDDGRAWRIELTASGRAVRREAVDGARRLNDKLCEGFGDDELAIVARWLAAAISKFPRTETDTEEDPR